MNKRLSTFIYKIKELLEKKDFIIIGIDGNCASGKTTIATQLSEIFSANVIHMDDFFLPANLRSKERYEEIGGNIHYERFSEEVINGLMKLGILSNDSRIVSFKDKEKEEQIQESFSYHVFSCKEMDYIKTVQVKKKTLTIIEGAYSHYPKFSSLYDLKVFSYADFETQKERIRERNGEKELEQFIHKWIPLEERYFKRYKIKEQSDLII